MKEKKIKIRVYFVYAKIVQFEPVIAKFSRAAKCSEVHD